MPSSYDCWPTIDAVALWRRTGFVCHVDWDAAVKEAPVGAAVNVACVAFWTQACGGRGGLPPAHVGADLRAV